MVHHYNPPLVEGIFLKRYNRFLADVQLPTGEVVTVHCPNPGRMTSCLFSEGTIRLLPTPKNRLKFRWVQSLTPYGWAGVDTMLPNALVYNALKNNELNEIKNSDAVITEFQFNHSRFDFFLPITSKNPVPTLIEVKSVTWYDGEVLLFPDAPSLRAVKHLETMIEFVKNENARGFVIYIVQHPAGNVVHTAKQIDIRYSKVVEKALKIGIQFFVYRIRFTKSSAVLETKPLNFGE